LRGNPDYVVIFVGINNPMSERGCFGKFPRKGTGFTEESWVGDVINDLRSYYAKVKNRGPQLDPPKEIRVIGITLVPAVGRWSKKYDKCLKNDPYGIKSSKGDVIDLEDKGQKDCYRLRCDALEEREPGVFTVKRPGEGLERRNPSILLAQTKRVNDWIRSNADIVIDAASALSDESGILPAYDSGDGIHLNNAAHQWIAREISRIVGPTVAIDDAVEDNDDPDDIVRESKEGADHPGKSCEESHPEVSHDDWVEDQANEVSGAGGIAGVILPLGMSAPSHGRKRKPAWQAAGSGFARATPVGDIKWNK